MAISNVDLTDTFDDWRQTTNDIITQLNAIGPASSVSISGGTINGTSIGASDPSTGVFTTLTVSTSLTLSGASLILDDNAISGNKISGGTIDLKLDGEMTFGANVLIDFPVQITLHDTTIAIQSSKQIRLVDSDL